MKKVLLVAAMGLTLAGCGKKDEVSFDALESARSVVNANAQYNATKFRAENGYSNLGLLVRGDSTQQPSCPQGDGWASVDLLNPETKQPQVKLKCSTVSPNIGCMAVEDFKNRVQYVSQENTCNPSLPYPPKKIEQ